MAKKEKLLIPKKKHYAALGHFVSECSSMEAFLNLNLRLSIGIEEEVARIIIGVGDLRVPDLITLIKRVSRFKKIPADAKKAQDLVLTWCAYFGSVRSVVAHKTMLADKNMLYFHNRHTAKELEKSWTYECSIEQLNKAVETIDKLLVCLIVMIGNKWFEAYSTAPDRFPEFPTMEPEQPLLEKQGLPARPAGK